MTLALLCDENVPRGVVLRLREVGFATRWIGEVARGATDQKVLELAHATGCVLVTFDKDFGELAARQPGLAQNGVILLRLREMPLAELGEWIAAQLLARQDWPGHFAVIEAERLRMRPLRVVPPG